LANRRAWDRLPADVREVAARSLNAGAQEQRDMLAEQDKTVRAKLEGAGMVFNAPEPGPFREVLNRSGFYGEWKGKFGGEAWALLEKYSGTLG
jgi:TRAP-type C4-dicarboxylate transport system substrate-binding protein